MFCSLYVRNRVLSVVRLEVSSGNDVDINLFQIPHLFGYT